MRTTDVYLSSALLSLGYKLDKVNRTDPRHMVFEFSAESTGNLKDSISEYNLGTVETQWANRTLQVNAFDYAEAIKRMKSLIHSS